jgi:hypothetical protein
MAPQKTKNHYDDEDTNEEERLENLDNSGKPHASLLEGGSSTMDKCEGKEGETSNQGSEQGSGG